jgi:2-iminobutanoate/2-iminopropanoate deaminase
MTKEIIQTGGAPKSPAYSQAVKSGEFVFVSGQGPFDSVSGDVVGDSIQEQTRQCLTDIKAILTAAGSSLDKVVSATFILYDESDFAGMNEEWVKWFPTDPLARQGAKLPIHPHGMKISIAVIAEA